MSQFDQNERRYQALLNRGMSPEKAARILAAEVAGGEPETYEDWSDEELHGHADALGIGDRLEMTRAELIAAIRDH